MPVILSREGENQWLDPDPETDSLRRLLAPYPGNEMQAHQVSKLVNNPANDTEDVVKPEKRTGLGDFL